MAKTGRGAYFVRERYTCPQCEKRSHATRKQAKEHARLLRQQQRHDIVLNVYRCPVDDTRWHVGHGTLKQQMIDEETSQ